MSFFFFRACDGEKKKSTCKSNSFIKSLYNNNNNNEKKKENSHWVDLSTVQRVRGQGLASGTTLRLDWEVETMLNQPFPTGLVIGACSGRVIDQSWRVYPLLLFS